MSENTSTSVTPAPTTIADEQMRLLLGGTPAPVVAVPVVEAPAATSSDTYVPPVDASAANDAGTTAEKPAPLPIRFTFEDPSKYKTDDYEITSAEIVGTTLKISVTYGGGYLAHQFGMAVATAVASDAGAPPHYRAQIMHKGGEDFAMAEIHQDLEFDLSRIAGKPFSITIDDSITLNYVPAGMAPMGEAVVVSPEAQPEAGAADRTTGSNPVAAHAPSLGEAYASYSKGRPFWFALSMATQLADTANIVAKGVVENQKLPDGEFSTAFPIIPYPNFGIWHTGSEMRGLKEDMSAFLKDAVEGLIDPKKEAYILLDLQNNPNLENSTKKKVTDLIAELHDESLSIAKKKAKARQIEYLIGGANDFDGFNDFQDTWTLSVGITNSLLTSYFLAYQLAHPPEIRTDGQLGFGFGILNHVMEPQHLADGIAIMISNHQLGTTPGDLTLRTLTTGAAMTDIVMSSVLWKGMDPLFETGCSPVKLSYFDGSVAECNAYLDDRANGNDAAIEFAFDDPSDTTSTDRDNEGLKGIADITLDLEQSDYRQAYAYGSYLMFMELETDGRPGWGSFYGLTPFVVDLAVNAKLGQPLNGSDMLQRLALAGGAFALNSLSTDPDLNVPNSHALAYAAKSPDYMSIVSRTTAYNDPLSFLSPNQNGYDNPDSVLTKTAPFATGGYLIDTAWNAGFMGGYGLVTSRGLQQWLPLITTGVAFGLQAYNNTDEANNKYMGFGLLTAGAGLGLGAFAGGTDAGRAIMAMKPNLNYNPATDTVSASITIPLDKKKK